VVVFWWDLGVGFGCGFGCGFDVRICVVTIRGSTGLRGVDGVVLSVFVFVFVAIVFRCCVGVLGCAKGPDYQGCTVGDAEVDGVNYLSYLELGRVWG